MRRILIAIGAALAALAVVPVAAHAESGTGRHCAVQLTQDGPRHQCFGTFRQAIAFGTDGAITSAPDATAAATDPGFQAEVEHPATRAANVLIGIEYDATNFGGNTFSVFRYAACTGPTNDVDKQIVDLDVIGWNDKVSSFRTYNNCIADHYYLTNFGGVHTGYLGSSATMPVINGTNMNDNARSIRWS
ncbi:hypothetical protein AB0M43_08195 [Longispora sp. NPDC051575]|uniref:hypothetical protein n=1 Tax=Longispora sp. NPDC051575 TaxID=3154943 RepID=UPI003427EFE9